jgi:signal transduction histidine kinase
VDSIGACARIAVRTIIRTAGAVLVAGQLAASATPAFAAVETCTVLVLYSLPRMQPAIVEGDRGLHQTIRTTVDRPVLVFDESLDAPRFGGPAYESTVVTYLREKYAPRPPDVIVAVAENSLGFLLRHRAELFTGVPVVHSGVSPAFLGSLPHLPADVVGVPVEYDARPTVDLARRWHPRARRLVIVTGTTEVDRRWEAQLRAEVPPVAGHLTVEFLAGLPMSDVLVRLAGLGRDAVVFTSGFYCDGAGRSFIPRDTVAAMAAASAAPVYSSFSTMTGTGTVGGYVPSFEAMGRQAGETVNELLAGAAPHSLRLPPVMPQVLNLDWRQVRRWGIDEGAVPADAIVHFKSPTLLEAYRNEAIIALLVVVVQAVLIGLLLAERSRRRSAELAEQKQRADLAHASRLAIAGELTSSIAHEINQPLGAILANADAAELILSSDSGRRDELRAILADIRRDDSRASEVIRRLRTLIAKHEVERRPFDVNEVVRDVESMLAAEARRRRVTLDARLAATPAMTVGDRIQFQQVLINLVLNAMDAVAEMRGDRRAVAVAAESAGGHVAVAVRDRGIGIPPEHLPKLFESFFTTKREGMGLGLSIARTLVESHGGRIWAENDTGSGAVFRVELPAAGATAAAVREPV